jgi:hypothetical protein
MGSSMAFSSTLTVSMRKALVCAWTLRGPLSSRAAKSVKSTSRIMMTAGQFDLGFLVREAIVERPTL